MTIIRIMLSLLCGMCIGISLLQAQPDFRFQNVPRVGTSYTLRSCDPTGVIVQPGGASQVWDYSTLVPQSRRTTIFYLLPAQTPFRTDFPAANLVQRTDSSYIYWRVDPNGMTKFGTGFQDKSKELLLADPYDIGPLPIKYLQRPNDGFRGSFVRVTPTTTVVRGGKGEFFYDGFGSLRMPDNVIIPNVMRLVSTQITADTSKSGTLKTVGITKITTYQWIAIDSIAPSLVITEIENSFAINDQIVSSKQSKVVQMNAEKQTATSTMETDVTTLHLSLAPNPASEQSILRYTLQTPGVVSIDILDVLGNTLWQQRMEEDAGDHALPLEVQNFASGVYYIRLRTTGNRIQTAIPLRILH